MNENALTSSIIGRHGIVSIVTSDRISFTEAITGKNVYLDRHKISLYVSEVLYEEDTEDIATPEEFDLMLKMMGDD